MAPQEPSRREFVRFAFYKAEPAWRELDAASRQEAAAEVEGVVARYAEGMMIRPYSTVGVRADSDYCFWTASHELDSIQDFARDFGSTRLGRASANTHSLLAMTKRSMYLDSHSHPGQERLHIKPSKAKYVFVYPFVKTRQWYLLPKEERQRVMDEHIAIGHKYPSVKINTTYSFGLDDQDFVVAFETNEPADFLDLVMELRETEGSLYTVRDTPIFTCVSKPLSDVIADLGGSGED
jgi:chlorite dismutase